MDIRNRDRARLNRVAQDAGVPDVFFQGGLFTEGVGVRTRTAADDKQLAAATRERDRVRGKLSQGQKLKQSIQDRVKKLNATGNTQYRFDEATGQIIPTGEVKKPDLSAAAAAEASAAGIDPTTGLPMPGAGPKPKPFITKPDKAKEGDTTGAGLPVNAVTLDPKLGKFNNIFAGIEKAKTQEDIEKVRRMIAGARAMAGPAAEVGDDTDIVVQRLNLAEKQLKEQEAAIKSDKERAALMQKIADARKKHLEFLKTLNGTLDKQQKQALLNLQREVEVRKALDANANAIKQSLTDQVRMGDPQQIQDGIVKNLQSGLTALIGPDQRNVELSKQAEKILTARRQEVIGAGQAEIAQLKSFSPLLADKFDKAVKESGGDPLAAAQKLLADKTIKQNEFDQLSKAMQGASTEARKNAEKEIAGITAKAVKNTTTRLLESDLSTKTADDFTKDIQN
jgi:hypothetical protein